MRTSQLIHHLGTNIQADIALATGRQLLALSRRTPISCRFFSSEIKTPVETAVQTPPKETITQEPVPQPDNPLHEVVQASRSKAPTAEAEAWGKLENQSEQPPDKKILSQRSAADLLVQDAISTNSVVPSKNPTTQKTSSTTRPDHQTSPSSSSSPPAHTSATQHRAGTHKTPATSSVSVKACTSYPST